MLCVIPYIPAANIKNKTQNNLNPRNVNLQLSDIFTVYTSKTFVKKYTRRQHKPSERRNKQKIPTGTFPGEAQAWSAVAVTIKKRPQGL